MRRIVPLLALAVVVPTRVEAADVTGVVLREPAAPPPAAPAERHRERGPRPPAAAQGSATTASCQCNPGVFAVVHLTGDHLPRPKLQVAAPAMAQKDRTFVPSVLAVPVGGSVEFPNEDPFFHNVFSYAKSKSFDLGRYPAGDSHEVVFDKPGVIPIFCEIHYSMRAYIHVFDTPYFAVSDEARRFEIPDVAPGDYMLHVWQENLPEITLPITVGREPLALEVQ
jgi:plastocyanin